LQDFVFIARVVSNFILWRLILGFIPELTVSFQETRNEYRKAVQVSVDSDMFSSTKSTVLSG